MTPDPFTDRLSEYLDDELSAVERASMDRHLADCAACRRTLDDLGDVVRRAASLDDEAPGADLWAGVAARLEPPSSASPIRRVLRFWKSPGDPRPQLLSPRTVSFTLPQLAAASLTLMVLSGGLVWLARSGDPRADIAPVVAVDPSKLPIASAPTVETPEIRPANFSDAHYDDAISDLEAKLNEGRAKLDPETVRVLEENLNAIDRAIDQCRKALAADPANVYLNTHLAEARQHKLALLRRATALAATAGS